MGPECPVTVVGDATWSQFIRTCPVEDSVPVTLARRAAELRRGARKGCGVDGFVVVLAEPNGAVLTGDVGDLLALTAQAQVGAGRGVKLNRQMSPLPPQPACTTS